jgi:hypothetical protein
MSLPEAGTEPGQAHEAQLSSEPTDSKPWENQERITSMSHLLPLSNNVVIFKCLMKIDHLTGNSSLT